MGLAERTADGQEGAVKGWLTVLEQKSRSPGKAGATKPCKRKQRRRAALASYVRQRHGTESQIENLKFDMKCASALEQKSCSPGKAGATKASVVTEGKS
jgi:hypothetical protein